MDKAENIVRKVKLKLNPESPDARHLGVVSRDFYQYTLTTSTLFAPSIPELTAMEIKICIHPRRSALGRNFPNPHPSQPAQSRIIVFNPGKKLGVGERKPREISDECIVELIVMIIR